ncbi:MAG TPA: alpha/beta fold hydrolase [Candidatus Paceibacterota bacterium]
MNKPNETLRLVKHFTPVQAVGVDGVEKEEVQETLILTSEKISAAGRTPEKIVVFIHGFNKFGAWENIHSGNRLVENGYMAALPSQMGFGGSEGERDYCGPKTVRAIVDSVQMIANEHGLTSDDIVIWGVSRGAIITSLIATKYPDLAAGYICQAGAYDFLKNHNDPARPQDMKENVIKETNGDVEGAARDRSAIFDVERITKPLLVLHGDADDMINVEQAYLFEAALKVAGKTYEMHIVPGGTHHISRQVSQIGLDFVKRTLK